MNIDAIILNKKDNVATALRDLKKNDKILLSLGSERRSFELSQNILYGHKFALVKIKKGGKILKYGEIIGRAIKHINEGMHVHVHNIESLRGRGDIKNKG